MFRNSDRETCKTGYLNYNSYGFSFATIGSTTVLDSTRNSNAAAALGECGTGRFRPDGGLWVRIIMTRHGWNAQWDGYAFSHVKATFGDQQQNGMETVWTYYNWSPSFCDGCNGGYSSWFQLTKYWGKYVAKQTARLFYVCCLFYKVMNKTGSIQLLTYVHRKK